MNQAIDDMIRIQWQDSFEQAAGSFRLGSADHLRGRGRRCGGQSGGLYQWFGRGGASQASLGGVYDTLKYYKLPRWT